MAVQKEANLNESLDNTKKATITTLTLTPDLASAVLNLNMDRIHQTLGLANPYLFLQGKVFATGLGLTVVGAMATGILESYLDNITYLDLSYVFQLEVFSFFTILCVVMSALFLGLSYLTLFLRKEAEAMKEEHEAVFGLDLEEYAKLPVTTKVTAQLKQIAKGGDTYVVNYRETPIATITVREVSGVAKITGYGVRRVYLPSGMYEDLLEWAKAHASGFKNQRELFIEGVYSFDTLLTTALASQGFVPIRTLRVSRVFEIFGVVKQTWAVDLHTEQLETISEEGLLTSVHKRGRKP